MSARRGSRWRWLERRAPAALVLGGGLVFFGILVVALVDVVVGEPVGLVEDVLVVLVLGGFVAGYALIVAGLLGLYPRLRDDAPGLARAGVAAAIVGVLAGAVVIALFGLVSPILGLAEAAPLGEDPMVRVVFQALYAGLALGFLSLGAATWRTRNQPRFVGTLLVSAGLVMLLPFAENLLAWVFDVPRPPILLSVFPFLFVPVVAVVVGYLLGTLPSGS